MSKIRRIDVTNMEGLAATRHISKLASLVERLTHDDTESSRKEYSEFLVYVRERWLESIEQNRRLGEEVKRLLMGGPDA